MNNLSKSFALFLLLVFFGMNSFAEQAEQAQDQTPMEGTGMGMGQGRMHKGMGMGGMHMGMMGNMSEEEKDKRMRSMQKHMLKMHDLSNKILATKNFEAKNRLKEQQIALMKAHMEKMMAHHKMMKQHQGRMQQRNQ